MQFYHILYPSSPESERNTFTSLESLHLKSRHSDQGLNGLRVWGSQSVTFRFVWCVKVAFGMWTFCKSTSSRIIGHKINWNGVKLWLLILQAFSESERRSLCFCAAFLLVPLLFFGRNQHLGLGIDWIDSVSVSKSCDFSLLETPFQTFRLPDELRFSSCGILPGRIPEISWEFQCLVLLSLFGNDFGEDENVGFLVIGHNTDRGTTAL